MYLADRNSNLELSHEADEKQLARKDRKIEELREELTREKSKTTTAQENAKTASESEEMWREEASKQRAVASQKEQEYEAIATVRTRDNDRHQASLDRSKANLNTLLQNRKADQEAQKRLEIITEQQCQTIKHLEEVNRKLTLNNQAYKAEIDNILLALRSGAQRNEDNLSKAVEDMKVATDKMKWVVNVERNLKGDSLGH